MSSVLKIVIIYILSVFVCVLVVSRRKVNWFLVTSSWPEVEVPGVYLLNPSLYSLFTFARTYFLQAPIMPCITPPSKTQPVVIALIILQKTLLVLPFSLLFLVKPSSPYKRENIGRQTHTHAHTQTHTTYLHFGIATDL